MTVGFWNSMSFDTRRTRYGQALADFLRPCRLGLLTGMPGNTGDLLIHAGTHDFLVSKQLPFSPVPFSNLESAAGRGGTLLIPGSGALTESWNEWLPDTVIAASRIFDQVVILPSAIDPSVPHVAEAVSRPNVFSFARDRRSYAASKAIARIGICPDLAVFYDGFNNPRPPAGEQTLLALRQDRDSSMPALEMVADSALNDDISQTRSDLGTWIQAIEASSFVITDRLHVAVAALMLGRKVRYFETADEKIGGYFDYTFRDQFSGQAQPVSAEWLESRGYIGPEVAA